MWAAHSGAGAAIMGGLSILGLWLVQVGGPSPMTSGLFALGLLVYVIIQAAGIYFVLRRWRQNGGTNGSHNGSDRGTEGAES